MAPDDWPDWLPTGWTMQVKKIDQRTVKCYLDPEGHKFYSKPQVFRHLKTINTSPASDKTHNADGSAGDISLEPDVPHKSEVPESAPRRRITKLTTGSSSKKSKETVGYLTGDGPSSEPDASQKDGVSEWLPDGWFMEVKTRECGSRIGMKYKCYTDPVSGRKFFSKPQVLNYLANTNSSVAGQKKGDQCSTEPDKSQKSKGTKVRNNKAKKKKASKTKKKKESIRKSFEYEVISRTPAEGLPSGWIKEVRMRKHASLKKRDPYYLDPLSGYTFFSKLDALRYLDTGDIKKCAMRPLKRDISAEDYERVGCLTGDGSSSNPDGSRKDDVSEWLPDGWIMEVKTRDSGSQTGMKYKCYTDPVSGRKFFSKPQVLNYLARANSSMGRKRKGDKTSSEPDTSQNSEAVDVGRRKRSKTKKESIRKSPYNEVFSTSPADGLPSGWIKEIKIRKYETHEKKDPYYTDPLSGYIFRSKLDALRYLETGDVSTCAIKPTKRDVNGKETSVGAVDGQKPVSTIGRQLFEGKEAENSVEKQRNDVSTDTALPTTEILEENHTNVDSTDPKTAERTSVSTPPTPKVTKILENNIAKHSKSSATLPGRSSKRLKGLDPETKSGPLLSERTSRAASRGLPPDSEVQPETERNDGNGRLVQEKQATGVNVEKQTDGVGGSQHTYQLGDASWTDQCLDFAVKTLTGEIPVDVAPISVPFQQESVGAEAGMNENPTKVN